MVVEITELELAPGASEDDFLAADRRVQNELVPFQPGFLRRTTARGQGRTFAVVVLWDSEEDAQAAADAAATHPAGVELMALVDPATVRTRRYTSLD